MSDKSKRPPLHPEVEAYWERMKDKAPDAPTVTSMRGDASPIIGKAAMHDINKKKVIPSEEKERVTARFEELRPGFPNKTSCYEAIAIELELSADRVRYIVEGSRRKKS